MRSFILSIITLCFFSLNAIAVIKIEPSILQKDAGGNWQFEKVINIENTSKKELYDRMKGWVISNIKTIDNNTLQDDASFETIITTPTVGIENLKYGWIAGQSMNFKLSISFKDNKLKVLATSFAYSGNNGRIGGPLETFEMGKAFVKDLNPKFDKAFVTFIDALTKAAMSNVSDW